MKLDKCVSCKWLKTEYIAPQICTYAIATCFIVKKRVEEMKNCPLEKKE